MRTTSPAGPASSRLTPSDQVARALGAGTVELPVLPRVANEVMAAAQDQSRGVADVARLVDRDPVLCATVLRSANSAIYGSPVEIVSARQAIARLGMLEVATLAMTAAVKSAVSEHGPYEQVLAMWWRESLATGLFAKEIARVRRQGVDSAFLCGLLRRVGVPVVLRVLARANLVPAGAELSELLDEFVTPAGLLLCDEWRLSAPLRATVAHGASPTVAASFAEHVATAQLASEFARTLGGDASCIALASMPQVATLNLYPDDLEKIAAAATAITQAVETMA